ncbi:MAG: hypothetical protein KGQ61_12480 [Planctomycetes bacterium]|nr:hypothetical protein [Planctomycetota bacterium]
MKRRGASLVELLAVITATSVILATGSGLIHRALSLQSASRHHLEHDRTALALGRRFRADVHDAVRVDAAPVGDRLLRVFTARDGTIDYVVTPAGLRRVGTGPGAGVREDYRLPAGTVWRIEREGALVRLSATTTAVNAPACDVEILARATGLGGER